ncbi:ABC transporter substrate-binding protein [Streptomyces capparidis]
MRRGPGTRRALAAVALSGALLATTACGQLPGGGGGPEPPIVVMTWAPEGTRATNMPGMPAVAQVYAKALNARGGIDGRELKVLTCNEGNDSQRAAACVREAIDADVAAVVGSYSRHGRSFMPALETAGIPYIGGYGIAPAEFTSPLSYPVNGGTPALLAGNGSQLAASGCDHVSLVRPDDSNGDLMPLFLGAALGSAKMKAPTDIRARDDGSDYGAEAARAVGDDRPGDCVTAVLGERTDAFLDSYRRVEKENTELSSVLGSVRQSLVDSTGGASGPLEGVHVTGWYPPENDRRWDAMREAVRRYAFDDQRITTADPGEQTTWIAYTVFEAVARSLDGERVDADGVRRALDRGKGFSTGGLTPRLSWRYEDMLPLLDHSRIVNTSVTHQVVRNGQLVAERKGLVDVRRYLEIDVGDTPISG